MILTYGLIVYAMFLGTFLYAIGFAGNIVVPKGIDDGLEGPALTAILINVGLLSVFALQHSIMARPAFKRWWTTMVPKAAERSTFVLLTNLALCLIYWQWRPMLGVVWEIESGFAGSLLWLLFWVGWVLVLVSTFIIDHFDLFGVRQVVLHAQGQEYTHPKFKISVLYNRVRHPLLLGFMIAFWATPRMTVGHLLFAAVTTAYMLVAIQLEERDLVAVHGSDYEDYQRRVPMIIPRIR